MKRVIALITAAFLIIRFFALTIYADYTYYDYLKEFWSATGSFISGDYNFSEYSAAVSAAAERYTVTPHISSKVDAIVGQVENAVNEYGPAAVDVIKGWTSDLFSDYQTTETVPTTDMKGGKSCIKVTYSNYFCIFYSNTYGEIDFNSYNNNCIVYDLSGIFAEYHSELGYLPSSSTYRTLFQESDYGVVSLEIFGDWRYESDGSSAETDDEYTAIPKYDFSQKQDPTNYDPSNPNNPDNMVPTTEKELEDLLDKLNEVLEVEMPDLSSVESTLKALYYRLGQIDSDNDGAKLDMINSTIISALQGGEKNEKLMDVLLEMRKFLKNGSSGDEHEISGTLYNVKPLDKNWLNKLTTDKTELKVEYEGNIYYLESDGCLKVGDKYYHVDFNYDSYTNIDFDFSNENIYVDRSKYVDVDFKNYNNMWTKLSDTQKKKLNDITDLIAKLLEQGIPYSAVTGGLTFYQDIIFNSHDPKDITLNLELFGQEYNFTILSTSFFGEQGAQALQIIKNFVAIVLCYVWLLSMRRKTSSMMR